MPSQSAAAPTGVFPRLVRVPAGEPCPGGVGSHRWESSELEIAEAEAPHRGWISSSRWAGDLSCSAQGPGPDGPSSIQAPVGQEGNTGPRAFRKALECMVLEASYMATGAGKDTCGYRFLSWEEGTHCRKCWVLPASGVGPTDLPALAVTLDRQAVPGEGEGLGATQWACSSIIGNHDDQGQLTLPEGHLASKGRGQQPGLCDPTAWLSSS